MPPRRRVIGSLWFARPGSLFYYPFAGGVFPAMYLIHSRTSSALWPLAFSQSARRSASAAVMLRSIPPSSYHIFLLPPRAAFVLVALYEYYYNRFIVNVNREIKIYRKFIVNRIAAPVARAPAARVPLGKCRSAGGAGLVV